MKFDLKKPEEKKPSKFQGNITINLNLKKILKGSMLVALLLGVFFLGRLSVPGNFSVGNGDLVIGGETDLSAAAVLDDHSESVVEETKDILVKEVSKGDVEEILDEKPADEDFAEDIVEETKKILVEEPVVTTYENVDLILTKVDVDWKETWGKISSVYFTLKNDESGTIEPDYFTLMVEGYPADQPGEFEVSYSTKNVKSHTSVDDGAVVYAYGGKTKGFSYSPSQTGDVTSVEVKLFLWDKDKNLIAHSKMDADLSG